MPRRRGRRQTPPPVAVKSHWRTPPSGHGCENDAKYRDATYREYHDEEKYRDATSEQTCLWSSVGKHTLNLVNLGDISLLASLLTGLCGTRLTRLLRLMVVNGDQFTMRLRVAAPLAA
jgi:hypothetical protein